MAEKDIGQDQKQLTTKFEKLEIGKVKPVIEEERWEKCPHILSKVPELYGRMKELSELLDVARLGDARKNIKHLVQQILEKEDLEKIWRAPRGGTTPAMHFIQYLATKECPTITEFMSFIPEAESAVYKNIKHLLEDYDDSTSLSDCTVLDKIAEYLSESIDQPPRQQTTWKDVASKAGISLNKIYALNSPRDKALENESMTEAFVGLLSSRYPDCRVVVIIHGLREIERNDAIQDCEMFKPCIEKGCLDRCLKEEKEEEEEEVSDLC